MRYIFDAPGIRNLDVADGLKQLLYEKHCDLDFLLQSDAATVAHELGIEEYVAKIIIDAAKNKQQNNFLTSFSKSNILVSLQ